MIGSKAPPSILNWVFKYMHCRKVSYANTNTNTCASESIRKFPKRYGKVRKIIQGKGSMYSLEFIMDVLKRTYSHYAWCFLELESAHPCSCVFCESICISKTLSYVFVYFVRTSEQKYEYLMDLSVYLYSVFSRWICVFVFAFQMYLCICILYFISVSVYLYSVFHRSICVFVFKE